MLFRRKKKKKTLMEEYHDGNDIVERNANRQWSCLETVIRLELEDSMKVKLSNGVIVDTDSIEVIKESDIQNPQDTVSQAQGESSAVEQKQNAQINVSRETSALLNAIANEATDNADLLKLLQDVQKEITELKAMNAQLATTTTSGVTQQKPEDVIYNMFKKEDK